MSDNYIERAARILCEKRGINPDANTMILCPDGMPGCCAAHYGPAWKSVVGEVRRQQEIADAMLVAREVKS